MTTAPDSPRQLRPRQVVVRRPLAAGPRLCGFICVSYPLPDGARGDAHTDSGAIFDVSRHRHSRMPGPECR